MLEDFKKLKTKLKFINGKYARPILKHIEVTPHGLTCTDLETSIFIKDTFNLAVGYQHIDTLGLAPSIPQDSFPQDSFPLISFDVDAPEDHVTVKLHDLFYCSKFASNDETRLHLNCVAFDSGHMIGIDGHTMRTFPTTTLSESYLIPRTSLKVLEGLIKGYKVKGDVTIIFKEGHAFINTDFFTFKARLIQREFPKWKLVVPKKFANILTLSNIPKYSAIKPLLNKRTNAVHIICENEKLSLVIPGHELSFDLGTYLGKDFIIGINMAYLERACNGQSTVEFKFNNELSPLLINEAIVMPLKV
jgi:DNA polymerase III sliding clamp (beta) subunit (PCNA family)